MPKKTAVPTIDPTLPKEARDVHLALIDRTFVPGEHYNILLELAITGKLRSSSAKSPNFQALLEGKLIAFDGPRSYFFLVKGKAAIADALLLTSLAAAVLVVVDN